VEGIRFERTEHTGDGGVRATGQVVDYPVQAVYRAVGYRGSALNEIPFDDVRGVIPNDGGRVLDEAGDAIAGLYATGWIKRGPVGLIGHTKGDALETVTRLVADLPVLVSGATVDQGADTILALLTERGVEFTTWEGWRALDAHEQLLGTQDLVTPGRERIKVISRAEQVAISRAEALLTL
jgi:ferredoxin--NADP+ reductase